MKIVTTCPRTLGPLYVSDIKPGLLKHGARGDWGYSTKSEQAVNMTARQAAACMRDMRYVGRNPRYIVETHVERKEANHPVTKLAANTWRNPT